MSDDHAMRLAALEQLDEDLFDFPDVEGMADLLAASRADAAASGNVASSPAPSASSARPAAAAEREPKAPLPAPKPSGPKTARQPKAAPRNAEDLDEDLFGFGELLELGAASDLGASDLDPDASLFDPSPRSDEAQTQKVLPKEPATAAPASAATPSAVASAPLEVAQDKPREPKRKKGEALPRPGAREQSTDDTTASPTPSPTPAPAPSGAADAPEAAAKKTKRTPDHAAVATASPFLTFPASIDLPPARSKLLWVLVGCFLLANGGVFLMTQQQNQNVNATLVAVTSTLAEAVARGSNATPREAPQSREPVVSDVDARRAEAPMLDPADFSNSNELGLHNARRLIEQGAYAEARRNLFFILANQDRSTPLTPALREDIDYLIALTYYDQGRSIAVEEAQ